jgi:hypothetical protein
MSSASSKIPCEMRQYFPEVHPTLSHDKGRSYECRDTTLRIK